MLRENEEIKEDFLCLWVYKKVKEKANGRLILPHYTLLEVIRRTCNRIPKKYDYWIIKDLEARGYIKKLNKNKYEITGGNRDMKLASYSYPLWG